MLGVAELLMKPYFTEIKVGILDVILIPAMGAIVQPAVVLFYVCRLVLKVM